jgi:hypothetical protein
MNETLKRLSEELLKSVKGYVARSVEAFDKRLKAVEDRTPVPGPKGEPGEPGLKGDPGERGEKGLDGSSIDPAAWAAAFKEAVVALPAGQQVVIPPIDTEAVARTVTERVLAAIPPPPAGKDGQNGVDGKDADPELVRSEVSKALDAAVAALPPAPAGQDGKDADPAPIRRELLEELTRQVAALPKPQDGKSVDIAEVKALVQAAVDEIPRPKDGADAVVDVPQIVARVLAQVPAPKDGQNGKDGTSVDPLVVKAMVDEAVAGAPGADGVDGKSVDAEAVSKMVGELVARAVAEIPKPANGIDGRDGERGLDAHAVSVLPGIDPTKRYQRNTYAAFRGGEVYAFRATDPLATAADPEGLTANLEQCGWQVNRNGEADFDVTLGEDMRTLSIRRVDTKGQVRVKQLRIPTMIYRDVWQEGAAYGQGDAVTRDGGTWVLMTERQQGRPGEEGSGWKLSVKKGRDGRDGAKGDKGERGAEGRAGKDRPAPMVAP